MGDAETLRYDVVILGGALAGASAALLLRRRQPGLRVLIIERKTAFDWKVGESTVESSTYFLTRILRLYDHLSREQLSKHGLRYWFHNGSATTLQEASEAGPNQIPRIPGYQVDRAKLDEHVLRVAVEEGAELWRPAKILEVTLPEERGADESSVRVERDGKTVEVRAGWLIDASGRSAIVARRRGWLHPLEEHPTSAAWARYRGIKDLDSHEISGDPDSRFGGYSISSRRLATNHFNGYGYWIWFIPLHGGETSIGAVWDTRLVQPEGSTAEEKLNWFLQGNPLTRELVKGTRPIEGDLWTYNHLPYLMDRVVGKGWSLVGDAAGFLDPFYSPGIDQIAFSVSWSLELIKRWTMKPDPVKFEEELQTHNVQYLQYMKGLFTTIYKDKYHLMGDYDSMVTAFLLDTALYYVFVASPLWRKGSMRLLQPPFYPKNSNYAFRGIRFYQTRLITIAQRKLKLGIYGNRNAGRRPTYSGFTLKWGTFNMLTHGLLRWMRAEFENAWTYIARPRPLKTGMPGPMRIPAATETAKLTPELVDVAPPSRT
ncbi:MAG: tryptophan 7-halogenase [Planctomycetes bacterium]|nr:tryptophan 7-halogenase [Planctomycetota bacterium]